MYYTTTYRSPVGLITLACEGHSLIGLWIEGQKHYGGSLPEVMMTQEDDVPVFDIIKNWLDNYFDGKQPDISQLPLSPTGSSFRKKVWNILREIPYGQVITYGDIARKIEAKSNKAVSCRAVGGAVGHNPISIIIPCHRVVGSNGSLTGYAGGITAKIKLLEHEGADMTRLFIPKNIPAKL